ncbi:MAG: hypothetical protein LBU61_04000 [Coriobacteriales bacterium]|jgi:hypothetical protein|nr:hypothetical protein [Coriobacteriales bacterium]
MVEGKWDMLLKTPLGDRQLVLDAKENGNVLEGGFLSDSGEVILTIFEGSVEGDSFNFKVDFPVPDMGSFTFTLDGTVTGDSMSGKAMMALGVCDFSAVRL